MQSIGYWYKNKKLFQIENEKHIDFIIKYPEKFNLTKEEVKAMYLKYNEKYGMEGKAREELIVSVIEEGWIRLRHYTRPRDYWSIQYYNFREQEKELHEIIETLIFDEKTMRHDDEIVFIGFGDESKFVYSFMNGGASKFLQEKSIKKKSITVIEDFNLF